MTIRVVIADDQGMVRSGFSVLLNAIFALFLLAPPAKALLQKTRPAAPASSIRPPVTPSPISGSLSP